MTGPTHVMFGIASSVLIARLTLFKPVGLEFLAVFLGSLAPDIDGDGSIARPGRLLAGFLPRRFARVFDELGTALSRLVQVLFGHRGFFHWPVLPVVLIAYSILEKNVFLFWFAFGYLGHLLADCCTIQGIPILAPLVSRRFSLGLLKTGSWQEALIFVCLLAFSVYWGAGLLPPQMLEALERLH